MNSSHAAYSQRAVAAARPNRGATASPCTSCRILAIASAVFAVVGTQVSLNSHYKQEDWSIKCAHSGIRFCCKDVNDGWTRSVVCCWDFSSLPSVSLYCTSSHSAIDFYCFIKLASFVIIKKYCRGITRQLAIKFFTFKGFKKIRQAAAALYHIFCSESKLSFDICCRYRVLPNE